MRRTLAKWLGYHDDIVSLRAECVSAKNHISAMKARHRRVLDAYDRTLDGMRDDDLRVETLIRKARHTININPKGAQAHLDQAVRILRGEA